MGRRQGLQRQTKGGEKTNGRNEKESSRERSSHKWRHQKIWQEITTNRCSDSCLRPALIVPVIDIGEPDRIYPCKCEFLLDHECWMLLRGCSEMYLYGVIMLVYLD